jgi:hypothetical protein
MLTLGILILLNWKNINDAKSVGRNLKSVGGF